MSMEIRETLAEEIVTFVVRVTVPPSFSLITENKQPVPSQSKATLPLSSTDGRPFHRIKGELALT